MLGENLVATKSDRYISYIMQHRYRSFMIDIKVQGVNSHVKLHVDAIVEVLGKLQLSDEVLSRPKR